MCLDTILVPMFYCAPFRCPYVSVHPFGDYVPGESDGIHNCPGTFQCAYVPRYRFDANICLVPICARVPLRCPYVPRHLYGAHMYPGTFQVHLCARTPLQCPYVPEVQSGFQYVPGHPSGDHMCPGTVPVSKCPDSSSLPKCFQTPFQCPSTLPVPYCAQAPFWCRYVHGHL